MLKAAAWLCRPAAAAADEAAAGVNLPYIQANEEALSMTRTSSASLMRMQGKATKQFMLTPGRLDFGSVKLGQVGLPTCSLKMTSSSVMSRSQRVHATVGLLQLFCTLHDLAVSCKSRTHIIWMHHVGTACQLHIGLI